MASAFAGQRGKLMAAGVMLIAAIVIFFTFRPGGASPLPDTLTCVCAATGKTYSIDPDNVKWYPAQNPDTGEETLFPCVEREDGMYVGSLYRSALRRLGEANRCVDLETLKVRTSE
jgi:hypothetical protein